MMIAAALHGARVASLACLHECNSETKAYRREFFRILLRGLCDERSSGVNCDRVD
jgi:hypothetical protein